MWRDYVSPAFSAGGTRRRGSRNSGRDSSRVPPISAWQRSDVTSVVKLSTNAHCPIITGWLYGVGHCTRHLVSPGPPAVPRARGRPDPIWDVRLRWLWVINNEYMAPHYSGDADGRVSLGGILVFVYKLIFPSYSALNECRTAVHIHQCDYLKVDVLFF